MPVTALDPACALVVIDMQKGIVGLPAAHPIEGVTTNVVRLVRAFRAAERFVVLVHVGWAPDRKDALRTRTQTPNAADRQYPPDFADFIDALEADPSRDHIVLKRQWGAFYGTDLELQLRRRGITNVVLCGVATSVGVESTARSAFEQGFNLTFATDAMTDMQIEAHERSLKYLFPRMGELGTTDEILARL